MFLLGWSCVIITAQSNYQKVLGHYCPKESRVFIHTGEQRTYSYICYVWQKFPIGQYRAVKIKMYAVIVSNINTLKTDENSTKPVLTWVRNLKFDISL